MQARVSIVMGSTSDLPIMEETAKILEEFKIPFEINALSAHRVPEEVAAFSRTAHSRGIRVIIAAAGGAAHLPGVIASFTQVPVIGVPIKASISIDGWDSILSILQMPPGIPVATVGLNAAINAAILAIQILATSDDELNTAILKYKENLKNKVIKANEGLKKLDFKYKV